jgi:DNA polymerase
VGNPQAEVMFIGEAPGEKEDLGAEPFIGAAGQYLNSLLLLAGLRREEIYIANVLKCRPPGNRDPRPEEIEACTPYLREQVRAIAPPILVTLGRFATQFILKTDRGITNLRGQVHLTGPFSVLPIFHPAAAIYDRSKEPVMEADFRLLGRLLTTRRSEQRKRGEQAGSAERGERGEQAGSAERAGRGERGEQAGEGPANAPLTGPSKRAEGELGGAPAQ